MRFPNSSDNEWLNELIEHDVARKGLDGFETVEGLGLFQQLLNNVERIPVAQWLEWLTCQRGLRRLASIKPQEDWINGLSLTSGQRRAFGSNFVFPCFESAGTWVCAGLQSKPDQLALWSDRFGVSFLVVAPTPEELVNVEKFYR